MASGPVPDPDNPPDELSESDQQQRPVFLPGRDQMQAVDLAQILSRPEFRDRMRAQFEWARGELEQIWDDTGEAVATYLQDQDAEKFTTQLDLLIERTRSRQTLFRERMLNTAKIYSADPASLISGVAGELFHRGSKSFSDALRTKHFNKHTESLTGYQFNLGEVVARGPDAVRELSEAWSLERVIQRGGLSDEAFNRVYSDATLDYAYTASSTPLGALAKTFMKPSRIASDLVKSGAGKRALDAGISLVVAIDDSIQDTPLPSAFFNAVRVRVLEPLVENSVEAICEHCDPVSDRTITLAARQQGSTIVFRVQDDGPGISLEVQQRMYDDRFTTKEGDRGIGLTLVRNFVDEQSTFSMELSAFSEGEETGSTFTLSVDLDD